MPSSILNPAARPRVERRRRAASLLSARRVDLLLLLVAVVWGSSYLAAKTLTGTVSVTAILSLRFLITAVALAVIWLVWHRRRTSRREAATGVVLGLTQAAVLILETHGIAGTSATNAGLIISLVVVFTPVTESIAFRLPCFTLLKTFTDTVNNR